MTAPVEVTGPATVDAVAGWLAVPAGHAERAHIGDVVPAVNALVRKFRQPVGELDGVTVWAADVEQGAVMLAARITRRRNSPGGVETFTELGPAYVSRFDPDIDKLLGLGGWRDLVVG